MNLIRKIVSAVLFMVLLAGPTAFARREYYDVEDFGAEGDGKKLCTEAIQATVDKCTAAGGGTVRVGPGKWLTGTIYLESNVELLLDAGCTLLGSRDPNHYARMRTPAGGGESYSMWAIVAGRSLENVSVRGVGTIAGQGDAFRWKDRARPKNIIFENCRNVLVENINMLNAGSWMQHYIKCEGILIRGIKVFNHVSYNNDGLNIDSCRGVRISDCMIDSDDDAIVLKSLSLTPCEDITITNCVVSSHCNSIKMGTESGGGFRNITVSNCAISSPRKSKVIYGRQRGLAGIALEIVDGGTMELVTVSNITIKGVTVPVFVRLGNRGRVYEKDKPDPGVGILRDVVISNIIASDTSNIGCSITGLPNHPVRNITLSDISLGFDGGGKADNAAIKVPEKEASYPESTMFGMLPAYGFYCRHVEGLKFDNVRLWTNEADRRPAIVCEDVAGLHIDKLDAQFDGGPMLWFVDIRDALISGIRPRGGLLLRLQGDKTDRVLLSSNDLSGVGKVAELEDDVSHKALIKRGNYHAVD
jgi:polygalacturonase